MNLPLNPTPKQEFLVSEPACKVHRENMTKVALRNSFNVALLHYQRKLTSRENVDGNNAAAGFMKLQGAQEFLDVLINLAEPPAAAPTKPELGKLDYKA